MPLKIFIIFICTIPNSSIFNKIEEMPVSTGMMYSGEAPWLQSTSYLIKRSEIQGYSEMLPANIQQISAYAQCRLVSGSPTEALPSSMEVNQVGDNKTLSCGLSREPRRAQQS